MEYATNVIVLLTTIFSFGYLLYALIHPERF